jgi:hypothetical protein
MAAWYVEQCHPGPHKSKRIAQRLGISPDMAKLLRQGRGWTLARVEQARRVFGPSFDQIVFAPLAGQKGGFNVSARLEEISAEMRVLAASVKAGPFGARDSAVAADRDPAADRDAVDMDRREAGDAETADDRELRKAAE